MSCPITSCDDHDRYLLTLHTQSHATCCLEHSATHAGTALAMYAGTTSALHFYQNVSGTCCKAYLFAVLVSLIFRHVHHFALKDTAERNDRFTAMVLDPFKDLHVQKVSIQAVSLERFS